MEAFHIRDVFSGMFGAACLVTAGNPFDVVKVRVQTGTSSRARMSSALIGIVRSEGILALWKGSGPAFSSAVIENAVVFGANGMVRRLVSGGDASQLTAVHHAVIGGLCGVLSATAICPAEMVKCRMQVQRNSVGPKRYRTGVHCLFAVARSEGIRGVFAGWTPLLARDVPFNTLFFGSYNLYCRLLFRVASDAASPVQALIAGGAAGMTAWTVILPFDNLKSRMQVQGMLQGAPTGMLPLAACVLRQHGVLGFYAGLVPALMRAGPANAALFWGVTVGHKLFDLVDGSP